MIDKNPLMKVKYRDLVNRLTEAQLVYSKKGPLAADLYAHKPHNYKRKISDALIAVDSVSASQLAHIYLELLHVCQLCYSRITDEADLQEVSRSLLAILGSHQHRDAALFTRLFGMCLDLPEQTFNATRKGETFEPFRKVAYYNPSLASKQILDKVCNLFLTENDEETRRKLSEIYLTYVTAEHNFSIIHPRNLKILVDNLGPDAVNTRCFFYAKDEIEHNPRYSQYRGTAQVLKSSSNNSPEEMKSAVNSLINQAYRLYQDNAVSEDAKANCNELLNQVKYYVDDVANIHKAQSSKNPEKSVVTDIEIQSLMQQAKKIERYVDKLSEDTSSLRWGRIIAVTIFGILVFGLIAIIADISINKENSFFKTPAHETVTQARELTKHLQNEIKSLQNTLEDTENLKKPT